MSVTATDTAWPEGVIARYLTVAGQVLVDPALHVEITEINRDDSGGGFYSTVAACSGCPASERVPWEDGFYDYNSRFHKLTREESLRRAEVQARAWAQEHAESCRAMPKPATPAT